MPGKIFISCPGVVHPYLAGTYPSPDRCREDRGGEHGQTTCHGPWKGLTSHNQPRSLREFINETAFTGPAYTPGRQAKFNKSKSAAAGVFSLEVNVLLKITGVILFIVGLTLACNPELISSSPMPTDAYQSIERRVKWGFVIGFGILLIIHHQLVPWLLTASALLFALTLGIVLARLLGMVLDGAVAKQWLWLGIELVALVIFGFWYWKQST